MRTGTSLFFGGIALAIGLMAITSNWPASPNEWNVTSTEVSWGWYVAALVFVILSTVIYWWRDIKRFYRSWKRLDESAHRRLAIYGIGRKEAQLYKNPWPKKNR